MRARSSRRLQSLRWSGRSLGSHVRRLLTSVKASRCVAAMSRSTTARSAELTATTHSASVASEGSAATAAVAAFLATTASAEFLRRGADLVQESPAESSRVWVVPREHTGLVEIHVHLFFVVVAEPEELLAATVVVQPPGGLRVAESPRTMMP